MKNKILVLSAVLVAAASGYFVGDMSADKTTSPNSNVSGGNAEPEVLHWVAPMDENFKRDKPGKSPMGMDLVPVYANENARPSIKNSILIKPSIAQNLGLRTDVAKLAPWTKHIHAVGELAWDGSKVSKVFVRAEGWLETFAIESVGQRITQGQNLFSIYAPNLLSAQQEFVAALKSGNGGLIENGRMRLLALGASSDQVDAIERSKRVQRLLPYVAERSGVVTALSVAEGSYVTPQTEIATIANTDQVWVEAELHESDVMAVKVGDSVRVSLVAYPGQRLEAKLVYIYPELNPKTRSAKVRAVLPNPDGLLRAGMFARLELISEQKSALQIPREAVIRARAGNRVVVAMGDGQFVVKPVLLGSESETVATVLEGLELGEAVVTSAQFLLDSEANGYQALARLGSLRTAESAATIMGFPQRGRIRLLHESIAVLDWLSKNTVFAVADDINLMPFNKEDRVSFELRETLAGEWVVERIEPLTDELERSTPSKEINHGAMNHD